MPFSSFEKGRSRGINSLWALDLDLAIRRLAFSAVASARSAESDEGTGLIEQLSGDDLASAVDGFAGFDAHSAAAMADIEEESHSSSEEDLENEPVL